MAKAFKRNDVERSWRKYRGEVIPRDASSLQLKESKRAFYAGVTAMLNITIEISSDRVSEDAAVHRLETVHQECKDFYIAVSEGMA